LQIFSSYSEFPNALTFPLKLQKQKNHIMCYFVCSCLQVSTIIHFLTALDQTSQQF